MDSVITENSTDWTNQNENSDSSVKQVQEETNNVNKLDERIKELTSGVAKEIDAYVKVLSPYLQNPDKFLENKLKLFNDGVERIKQECIAKKHDDKNTIWMKVQFLRSDIKKDKTNEELIAIKKAEEVMKKDIDSLISNFDVHTEFSLTTTKLLEEVMKRNIEEGNYDCVIKHYAFLKNKGLEKSIVNIALEQIKKEKDDWIKFVWITKLALTDDCYNENEAVNDIAKTSFHEVLTKHTHRLLISNEINDQHLGVCQKMDWFDDVFEPFFKKFSKKYPSLCFALIAKMNKALSTNEDGKVILNEENKILTKRYVVNEIKNMFNASLKDDRVSIFENVHNLKIVFGEKEFENIMMQIIPYLDEYDCNWILYNHFLVKLSGSIKTAYTEKVITTCNSVDILVNYETLFDETNNSEFDEFLYKVIDKAVEANPSGLFNAIQNERITKLNIGIMEYEIMYEKVLQRIIVTNPELALQNSALYKALNNGEALMKKATERSIFVGKLFTPMNALVKNSYIKEQLLLDPALENVEKIDLTWFKGMNFSTTKTANYAVQICRNLYMKNKIINGEFKKSDVLEELVKIMETQYKYKEKDLFFGRNILIASHSEKGKLGIHRFGKAPLITALKKQQNRKNTLTHFRPKNDSFEELRKTKENILQALINTPHPMTFIFDGHGMPDAIYLSNGQIIGTELKKDTTNEIKDRKTTISINVKEFAQALIERDAKSNTEDERDILIFHSCFNHNFIRNVYELLQSAKIKLPIAFGESEYGQLSFTERNNNQYGSRILKIILKNKRATLEDYFNLEDDESLYTNPSCYIPNEENIPQQVSINKVDAQNKDQNIT